MSRAFNQLEYPTIEVRLTLLRGYALKFTLVLPVLWKGQEVFSGGDEWDLQNLLTEDFGGCTYTYGVSHPLYQGTYVDETGNVVRNENAIYTIYAAHSERSIEYFRELQGRLQEHSGEEKILIEMLPVQLL